VPHRNRVTPAGDLVTVPDRGTLTGNRGVLHDASGEIVRRAQVRRWITCLPEFRGRHREVMTPGRYTHLFFLDEATALAAGHRPCAECRNADYRRFRAAWAAAHGTARPRAEAMDDVLHAERALTGGRRATRPRDVATLPDGVFVTEGGDDWLLHDGALHRWTPGGYAGQRPKPPPGTHLALLTPPATVAVIARDYPPGVHVSARRVSHPAGG
jgi:hypothetical protein